jgi:CRISPR-associated protein Cmr4
MFTTGCFFTFYTLTPLHAGAGDSAGAIDLPVQRERHTEYPVVHSSGIKGSLRDFFERNGKPNIVEIFGKERDEQGSGKVIFTDAKILLFPVRSSEGVFKWVTCPFVITRLLKDLEMLGITNKTPVTLTVSEYEGKTFNIGTNPIILEDFKIELSNDTTRKNLFIKLVNGHFDENILEKRLIIVSDNVFKTLVTTATQIIARNELINETKKSNNLWYEEVVPADAMFYTIMLPAYKEDTSIDGLHNGGIAGEILQIGGNETIGYGIVKMSNDLSASLKAITGAQEASPGGGK